jgi:hypothetical protein
MLYPAIRSPPIGAAAMGAHADRMIMEVVYEAASYARRREIPA